MVSRWGAKLYRVRVECMTVAGLNGGEAVDVVQL